MPATRIAITSNGRGMLAVILALVGSTDCSDVESGGAKDVSWRLDPVVSIGSEQDSRYVFNQLGALTSDSSGRIYAADIGDRQIKVFDSAGTYVRTIGAQGTGPGEFETIAAIGIWSDTLYAVDQRQQRVTYFDTTGALLRTEQMNDVQGMGVILHAAFPGGRYLVSPVTRRPSAETPTPRWLISRDQVLDTVGSFSGGGLLTFRIGNSRMSVPDPFALPQFLAVSSDGSWWVEVYQHPEDGLEPGEVRLSGIRTRGGRAWSRLFSQAPVPYPIAETDSLIDRIVDPGGRPPLSREEVQAAITIPKYKYQLQGLVVAANGDIWLRLIQHGGEDFWAVIDSTGADVGSVRLPPGARLATIQDRRRVVLILRDEYDVQTIRAYNVVSDVGDARD